MHLITICFNFSKIKFQRSLILFLIVFFQEENCKNIFIVSLLFFYMQILIKEIIKKKLSLKFLQVYFFNKKIKLYY